MAIHKEMVGNAAVFLPTLLLLVSVSYWSTATVSKQKDRWPLASQEWTLDDLSLKGRVLRPMANIVLPLQLV